MNCKHCENQGFDSSGQKCECVEYDVDLLAVVIMIVAVIMTSALVVHIMRALP